MDRLTGQTDGSRMQTDTSSVPMDGPSVEMETEMPANIRRNVRTAQIG